MIINELIEWKNSVERKPLILRGARQVGKTSVVHQLGGKYKQYIYLNLELDAELFLQNITVEKLVEAIFFIHIAIFVAQSLASQPVLRF